jgi:hypothetical protein
MTILNVRDYGARGDGSADDTAAIQRAIDDASDGDTVYVPAGTYVLDRHAGEGIIVYDGDDHASPLTIEGDGPETVLKMQGGQSDTYRMIRHLRPRGNEVLLRNMVFDGNKSEHPSVSGTAVEYRSTDASGTGDMRVEDVEIRDCASNGMIIQYGGVTAERVTVHGCHGHGIAVHTDSSGHNDPPATLRRIHSYENAENGGRYAVDMSGGKGIIEDSVIGESVNGGGTKVSRGAIKMEYHRVQITSSPSHAFQNTGGGNGVHVVFDDVVFEECGRNVRLDDDGRYEIPDGSALIATGFYGDDRGQIHLLDDATLDAGGGTIYSNHAGDGAAGLNSETSFDSAIGAYYHSQNDGGSIENQRNLKIGTQGEHDKRSLATVPTADEVGAWTDGSREETEGENGEESWSEPTEPDEKTAFESWTPRWEAADGDWRIVSGSGYEGEHALEFEHDGSERTRYAISWDAVGEPSDVEVLDKFRVPEFNEDDALGFHGRVHLRSSIDGGQEGGYWIETEARENAFRLGKYTDGDLTTLGRFGTPAENTFFYRRFRAEGETLRAKVWEVTEAEPAGWDIEVTDGDHSEGWVGLGSFGTEAVETDVLSVGIDGETAPGPFSDVSRPPSLSWETPDDGATADGAVSIAIDVTHANEASPTVEYRVDDGTWSSASYESGSRYVDTWNTTTVRDGSHTLEARVVDGDATVTESIEVTVENGVIVGSKRARSATEDGVTLVGELIAIGTLDDVSCYFEWRTTGSDSWNVAGATTKGSTGEFEAELDGLEAKTDYEFRAVADGSQEHGRTISFRTSANDVEGRGLSIDRFDVNDRSDSTRSWFNIQWAVSDDDGELDTVVTELRYGGTTVAADSTRVSGETASFSHDLRVCGDVDEARLSVNDTSNETRTETKPL